VLFLWHTLVSLVLFIMISPEHRIIHDNNDNIPAEIKNRSIQKITAEPFTLGPILDDDLEYKKSKNHWAIILHCPGQNVRLSMEAKTQ
jgi:hypothetical protein